MKRISIIGILILSCILSHGAERSERVYLSTDRSIYVAGEKIRCSAYCIDPEHNSLSEFSAIAYIELHSQEGMVALGRAALVHGRGGTEIELPRTLPTGNYSIFAYTAIELDGSEINPAAGAKLISIINPYGTQRAGVDIVDDAEYGIQPEHAAAAGPIKVTLPAEIKAGSTAEIGISSTANASIDLSIARVDNIEDPGHENLANFIRTPYDNDTGIEFKSRTPEFEGEIIRARVVGLDQEGLASLNGRFAFISAPGEKSDIYSSRIQENGEIVFHTNTIYGDKDLICEIEGIPSDSPAHIEIESPFVSITPRDISPLKLCPGLEPDIVQRSISSQIENMFASDTLKELLPKRENLLFSSDVHEYILDDYTRFPTMEEIIVEYIYELRIRKDASNRRQIYVLMEDFYRKPTFSNESALVMIDGVPIFDHSKVIAYDPLLIESANIYPHRFYIGTRYYDGIVNFITYHRNLPSVKFNQNVRIVEFKGAGIPAAYTCLSASADEYPDYRTTAYWNPVYGIEEGKDQTFDVRFPVIPGTYRLKVEGICDDGTAIYQTYEINVNQ